MSVCLSCVPASEPGHHELRVEDRPLDEGIDTLRQGLIQCDPTQDTGYRSGSPFSITVVTVDGKPSELETANAYYTMQQAAARDGVQLRVVSGFRSYDEQAYLYSCYVNCSCNNCNLAARPGYSNHQSGSALDLNTAERGVLYWLNQNGAAYGFYRTVPSEDWHWEFFGPPRGPGPCSANGGPRYALEFVDLQEGGHYQNGFWMKVRPRQQGLDVHHVRYLADGWPLGISERADDDFSLRYTFNQLGSRIIRAVAYDDSDRELGDGEVHIVVAPGAQAASLDFVSPQDGGWYRNGLTMRVQGGPEVVEVAYFAGGWELGRSADTTDGFVVNYTFSSMGYRALLAVGYDADEVEVTRKTIGVRVLPGQEGPVAVRFIAPQAGRT